jgi:hypothetical protein
MSKDEGFLKAIISLRSGRRFKFNPYRGLGSYCFIFFIQSGNAITGPLNANARQRYLGSLRSPRFILAVSGVQDLSWQSPESKIYLGSLRSPRFILAVYMS